MIKKTMRITAMILIIAMVGGLVPASAFAHDMDQNEDGSAELTQGEDFDLNPISESAADLKTADEKVFSASVLPTADPSGRAYPCVWNFSEAPFMVTDEEGTHPDYNVFPIDLSMDDSRCDVLTDSITPERYGGLKYSLDYDSYGAYQYHSYVRTFADGSGYTMQLKTQGRSTLYDDHKDRVFSFTPAVDGTVTVYARAGTDSRDQELTISQGDNKRTDIIPSYNNETVNGVYPYYSMLISAGIEVNIASTANLAFYAIAYTESREPISPFLCKKNDDGTLTLTAYAGVVESVEIPDSLNGLPITSIGDNAFVNRSGLYSVTVPESIQSIADNAFDLCPNLILRVYPGSYAEQYAVDHNISYEYTEFTTNSIKLSVTDENGVPIIGGYTVNWYNAAGDLISSGGTLSGAIPGEEYSYKIVLEEELGLKYLQPAETVVRAESGNSEIAASLKRLAAIKVSGKVVNKSEEPFIGADVLISQTINGSFKNEVKIVTGADGVFSANVPAGFTTVEVSANGYYSAETSGIMLNSDYDAGVLTLEKLPDTKITLALSKIEAVVQGQSSVPTPIMSFDGIDIKLFNKTKGIEQRILAAQYPDVTIDSAEAEVGDELIISLSDKNGTMKAEPVTAILDDDKKAFASAEFTENGRFNAKIISDGTASVIVFDATGTFVKKYDLNSMITSDPLPDGEYTVIFIKKAGLLQAVENISILADLGLVSGVDYTEKKVNISSGVMTEIGSVEVPEFDETRLYYTTKEDTYFMSANNTYTVGRLVTLIARYKVSEEHETSSEKLIFEIPQNVTFIDNSLVLNGVSVPYSVVGNKIYVNADAPEGTVKFYAVSTVEGDYGINGYLSLDVDGKNVMQPIGTASFDVESLSLTVPERTSLNNVTVLGKAPADSVVTVYMDDNAVDSFKSNSNGTWSVNINLNEKYSVNYHTIYASVKTEYGTVMTSSYTLIYDKNCAQLNKVTMYNTAHPAGVHEPVQNETVFNFLNPPTTIQSYRVWPGYPKFTFAIDITGTVENVILHVKTKRGEVRSYNAQYDEVKNLWLVVADFQDYYDSPVNVAVDFTQPDLKAVGSRQEFSDIKGESDRAIAEIEESAAQDEIIINDMDSILDSMTADNITFDEYEKMLDQYNSEFDRLFENSLGDESVLAASADYDALNMDEYAGMTEDEIIASFENEYDAIIKDIEELNAKTNEELAKQEEAEKIIAESFITKTCDGLTPEALEADGFTKIDLDDSSAIYIKADGNDVHMVDFKTDTYNIIKGVADEQITGALENSREITALAAGFDETANAADASAIDIITNIIEKSTGFVNELNQFVIERYKPVMEQFKNERDDAIKELQMYKDRQAAFQKWIKKTKSVTPDTSKKLQYKAISLAKKNKAAWQEAQRKVHEISVKKIKPIEKILNISEKLVGKLLTVITVTCEIIKSLKNAVEIWKSFPPETDCNREDYNKAVNSLAFLATTSALFLGVISAVSTITIGTVAGSLFATGITAGAAIIPAILMGALGIIAQNFIAKYVESQIKEYSEVVKGWGPILQCIMCDCTKNGGKCTCDDDPIPTERPVLEPAGGQNNPRWVLPDQNPLSDPSGYVCESVASNRLEGVTATVYYMDDETDEFGEPTGNQISREWNANDYDQINPMISDKFGEYGWDVPEGSWQVKFEKENYETAYSEWLSVPPPQTEVNIAMVSHEAPKVMSVKAYPDKIRITFSKYMRIDSVNGESVAINAHGERIVGDIQPCDAEFAFDDPSVMYAKTFIFIPESNISGSADVVVSGAESYSGTEMTAPYNTEIPVTLEPKSIEAADSVDIKYNSEAVLKVKVAPAVEGSTLRIRSAAPAIVSAGTEAAVGADGTAEIKLSGNLPGSGDIILEADGTDLSKTVTVNVLMNIDETTTEELYITASSSDGGTISPSGKIAAHMGDSMNFVINPSDGYVVDDVLVDGVSIGAVLEYNFENISESHSIEAKFRLVNSGGGSFGGGGGGSFGSNAQPTPAPTAASTNGPEASVSPDENNKLPFSDVNKSDWFYESVKYVYENNIMIGVDTTHFEPETSMSRGMLITVLGRCDGVDVSQYTTVSLSDVAPSEYYAPYIAWAMASGIVDGIGNNMFAPDDLVTREQAAKIFTGYYAYCGEDVATTQQLTYSDAAAISDWAVPGVRFCLSKGLMQGKEGGVFDPSGYTARAEAATILMRGNLK